MVGVYIDRVLRSFVVNTLMLKSFNNSYKFLIIDFVVKLRSYKLS